MKIFRADPLHRYHLRDEKIGLVDSLFLKSERQNPGFNRRMFDEDFARLFLANSHRSDKLFEITSNDDELMRKLLTDVKTRHKPYSVDEAIRQLAEEIAESLTCFGKAYYFLYDDKEREGAYVASLRSGGVVRLFGTYVQWIPKRIERHWDRDDDELPREIRILDPAKVMRFDIPILVKRMLSAQNRTLTIIDKHQFDATNFHTSVTHEHPNPTNHFDFGLWRDTQERALYRATRCTGWNGRKSDSSKRSDFFDCHRLIRFRRNQLLLRDDILKQLSGELSRVGEGYKAEFSVEISTTDDLPSVADLNELEERLEHEEVGFNEIIEYCYKR